MAGAMDRDDASIADLPWASVFDPANNVRALGAIQERGFRAATDVVSRFVQMTDRGLGAVGAASSDTKPDEGTAATYPDLGRIVASLQGVVSQLGQSMLNSNAAPSEASLDLVNSASSGQAVLEASEPGPAVTEIWLHNRGPQDMGKVRLRCSDLLAHDGALIEASAVRFEPDIVPMPARSSRGITVEIDVAEHYSPGRYRGTLLADGHDDVWLPVSLHIAPRSS
ncbi:hypothetical protein ACIA48_17980 [Mycobacterium sp. NPDC051804]|uniref:hypothetical protein n=1 Tax=Mycobacterium sp. NPDC051804 TaxID=3364295 RepID=UPI0037B2B4C9